MNAHKLDLTKADKTYYASTTTPQLAHFGDLPYLSIMGKGSPDGIEFAQSTEALYTVAYSVKKVCKEQNRDFTVAKLEGQWWVESDRYGLDVPREEWCWKLLIRMPDYVGVALAEVARQTAATKKKDLEPLQRVAFEIINEGSCVQILHIGPYSDEPATLAKMHGFMSAHSLASNGLHHEIYLSDPRKSAPSSMKTILRHPVKETAN